MDRKIYFIFCFHLIAALESRSLFNEQNEPHFTCVPVNDNYICYRKGEEMGFSIQKNKMDHLIEMSGRTLPDRNFDMQSKLDTNISPPIQKVWHQFEKRRNDRTSAEKSRASFKRMLVFAYKRFYPFTVPPNRKRPFDSISYRGQFGGFGGR